MRKTPVLNIFFVALLVMTPACGGKKYTLKLDDLGKKEWVVLAVEMHNGKCKLAEKNPGDIRTDGKDGQSFVNWIVVGHCPAVDGKPQRIAIDSNSFEMDGNKFNPFQADGTVLEVDIPTSVAGPWSLLTGHVKHQNEIPADKKGRYKYKVKINNSDAEWRSPADDGDFFLCPVWPCGLD